MNAARLQVAATLGIVLFVALVLLSGFDRVSETRQSFARFVPASLQVGAAKRSAAAKLSEGNAETAARFARLAVAHDPLDPRGLSFLGVAATLQGEGPRADAIFSVTERISRREPMAQIHFFERELASGDYTGAAGRLDAVLRAGKENAVTQAMLSLLERSAEGRSALALRLSDSPRWADAYLRRSGAPTADLRARAQILGRADGGIAVLGCEATLPMIVELARRNFRSDAEAIATRHCPEADPGGVLADAEFENFGSEGPAAAIGWRRYRTGDLRVTRLSGDEARIEIENRSSVTRLVISQPLAVDAGSYLVKTKVDGPGGQRVLATIDCMTPSRPRASRQRIDREGQRVRAPDCDDAILSLWLRPGGGRVVIDRVELERVSP
ncbi:hypothetical protein [Qipengyuania sp. 902]|uniref:hypothetical protein n=1 Tax=Qipengyuania sp. 902 TaxID=3417565 RepID=UPI003EB9308D